MSTKSIAMLFLGALSMMACAASEPVGDGSTTITDARVAGNGTGGVSVSSQDGTYDYANTEAVQTDGLGAVQSSGIGIRQRVGCQIQHCDSCTCGQGGCTCTGCTCVAR